MKKNIITGVTALAFVCASLLLAGCCTKKEVQVSKSLEPTTKEVTTAEGVKKAEEARQVKEEAESQAGRLSETEISQKLAQEVKEFESEKIYFDFDKSDLKPEARATLRKKADWLNENPGFYMWIEGHCDERGTSEYNLALGERRAHAAKEFLKALGVSEGRLRTISYGEERPADPGHNEEAWAKNRRDEFKLLE